MSARSRTKLIWSLPVLVIGSWLAVRALAAAPPPSIPASTITVADSTEIGDPSLRAHIGRLARAARTQNGAAPPQP